MTTIKVDRLQVIKTLTDKADTMEADNKAYDAARIKQEKAEEVWQKAVFKAADPATGKINAVSAWLQSARALSAERRCHAKAPS